MGADDASLVRDFESAQDLDGCREDIVVAFAAHHHANQRPITHTPIIGGHEDNPSRCMMRRVSPPSSMAVPLLHHDFDNGEQHAECRQKSFGALPVLFVLFHAPFQVRYPAPISIPHQTAHLSFQDAQIAKHLRFEFIHHPHPPDSGTVARIRARCRLAG